MVEARHDGADGEYDLGRLVGHVAADVQPCWMMSVRLFGPILVKAFGQ